MSIRASASKLVPFVVVLVSMLFFFHGSYGPFQISNGPTSTLKECVVGLVLQALILLLARVILAASSVLVSPAAASPRLVKTQPAASTSTPMLRC
jgi:hypothetical protein